MDQTTPAPADSRSRRHEVTLRFLAAPTDGVTGCQTNPTAAGCRSLTLAYTTVNNQTRAASVTAWKAGSHERPVR